MGPSSDARLAATDRLTVVRQANARSGNLPAMSAKVAVVGCGYWGRNLVRVFHEIGALAGVCDADGDLAAKFAQKYSVPARSLDELLADDTIQAVAIVAPAAMHADLAGQALHAGKHVFVEKPIALRATEAEELIAVAAQGDRVLMVG